MYEDQIIRSLSGVKVAPTASLKVIFGLAVERFGMDSRNEIQVLTDTWGSASFILKASPDVKITIDRNDEGYLTLNKTIN